MPAADSGHFAQQHSSYDQVINSMSSMSLSRPPRPPKTIAELAELAKEGTTEESLPLKQWLRNAESARKRGRLALEQDDFETAFIEMARAATIVLERLPEHRDYRTLLTPAQRHNMGLHGQDILDTLGTIKATLLKAAEDYERRPSTSTAAPIIRTSISHRPSPSASTIITPTSSRSSQRSRHDRSPRLGPADSQYGNEEQVYYRGDHTDSRTGYSDQQVPVPDPQYRRDMQWEQQQEMRRQEVENAQRNLEDQRRREQDGIIRRQREAEAAAQQARSTSFSQQAPTTLPGNLAMPTPSTSTSRTSRPQLQFPLESPPRPSSSISPWPSRSSVEPPLTTTSPPPPSLSIQYPSLMSQHQIKQGYSPSLASMFHQPLSHPSANGLYATPLPRASAPVVIPPSANSYIPSRRAPDPPAAAIPPPQPSSQPQHERGRSGLRRVEFPQDCLNRFMSIAAVNTKRNLETCGLLLGRDMGSYFIVTTLLIPKQHSTSDTCTMDEEELVAQFTEQRSLITLGWIHTHPTQSCFMSSVDLHTHGSFQVMLPESFAVVCAPSSSPNFGIFRLTDPVGLQTIMDCREKQAFHPHPNVPIYTDVDKSHVHLARDLPLEIVDLR